MKSKEIKPGEEFIASGFVFTYSLEDSKIRFKAIRKHDGKVKKEIAKTSAPSEAEVKAYAKESGYNPDFMWEKMRAYIDNDMKDSHEKPIKNWKMKLNQVWFKPEFKVKVVTDKTEMIR